MKILFTSIGRRVELIQAFYHAAEKLNIALTIIGTDITESAPALQFCDQQEIVCRISDERYIPQLLDICGREGVDCLIPMIDTDLLILAENKQRFEQIGTKVLVSKPEKVRICRDKNYTSDYVISLGLKSPLSVNSVEKYEEMIQSGANGFPAFIKPKDGSSSINAFKVENITDLKMYAEKIEDYIIQPFISGTEYTIDIFCDYEGMPVYITPRERIATRAGEVLKTRITQDDIMIAEMQTLIEDFKPSGQITVQLIRDKKTGDNYYIEINPRFGGGAPLSIKAGADSAEAILRMLDGEKLTYVPKAAEDNAVYCRFDQSVRVDKKDTVIKAIVFDLDDTLYPEKEYVRSGFHAVAENMPQIIKMEERLWAAFESGQPAIDHILKEEGIYCPKLAAECLNVYRQHMPDVHFYPDVEESLSELRAKGIKIGIITDGRPEGQRNKVRALGLEKLVDEIIITDEIGGVIFRKPCDIAFRIMQKKLNVPFGNMMYVGDNIRKDFIAPKNLGMKYIWFDNKDGLYFEKWQYQDERNCRGIEEILREIRDLL